MNTDRSPASPRRGLRMVAVASIPALIITGLATLSAVGPAVAEELPTEAESFVVAQSSAGEMSETFMTSDGQRVFYTSTATDLVGGDDNGESDIFVSVAAPGSDDPFSGAEVLVSAPDGPVGDTRAYGASTDAVASANGRFVAFTSTATNLTEDPTVAGRSYVYVRDLVADRTFLVRGAEMPDGDSYDPDLTDDGRYLVFTSTATNFAPTGPFGRPDNFVADLDADSDGTLGDMAFSRVSGEIQLDAENASPRISGNGRYIYFLSSINGIWSESFSIPTPYVNNLYRVERGIAGGELVWGGVQSATATVPVPSVDASGQVVAFATDFCGGDPSIAVSAWDNGFFTVAVGWWLVERTVGDVSAPTISADGNMVAWSTTQPASFSGPDPQPLATPVIRMEAPSWANASSSIDCDGDAPRRQVDAGAGEWPSLSASGRTISYADGTAMRAVDLHSHDGLSVTTVNDSIVEAGFMIGADTSNVPLTQLGKYASALADAPIYRLPIYRLPIYRLPIYRLPIYRLLIDDAPIYRLPIYRLPIYRLPIYRLDVPGGWAELLAETPFSGDLIQSVTLDEVLAWAAANITSDDEPLRRAAERIQSLSLDDMNLDDSGLDSLSMASIVLGSAPVVELAIPGPGQNNEERWQALVNAQGIVDAQGSPLDVNGQTLLAELESAGLDIGRSGVDAVALNSIPIAETLFDELQMTNTDAGPGLFLDGTPIGALDASSLGALFDGPRTGTLAANKSTLLPDLTAADLASSVPGDVTFGDLLFSLFDVESYPWEQVDPYDMIGASLGPSPGECTELFRCSQTVNFRFTFDAGPGEATHFSAPTATVTLPPQTVPGGTSVAATGPGLVSLSDFWDYTGPVQADGTVLRFPLDDTSAGSMYSFNIGYPVTTTLLDGESTATLTSGDLTASAGVYGTRAVASMDDPTNERRNGQWLDPFRPGRELVPGNVYYEWISPLYKSYGEGGPQIGPAADEDWFIITPPQPGQRLIVSTNATDGQIAMALYRDGAPTAPLGTTDAGMVPATPVTEQSTPAAVQAASGADVAPEFDGKTLVDQVSVGGDGIAQIEAASSDASTGNMLLRVSSGNGQPSSSLYSVRVRYLDEPAEVACTPWAPQTADLMPGQTSPIGDDTNTLFIIDTQRFASTHGATATNDVLAAIAQLEGKGAIGSQVRGAVISVDASPEVNAARSGAEGADAYPCSMRKRANLVTEINQYVASVIAGHEDQITSVVVVGGDDIVPFAPVTQNTSQFNEASHSANLRLAAPLTGGTCPETVPEGTVDPCATPLSAAAATNHILTDDPYGLADAYETLGGHLYLPTVAVGRLVDSPAQITAALQRFVTTNGVLEADSTLTAGYGAWSELPDLVTSALDWRSDADQELGADDPEGIWDVDDTESALFPTGNSARVVSINTHADERRMLPGIDGAEDGVFSDNSLLQAADWVDAPELSNALVFLIGCHAGNNLPGSYYGTDAADWTDVFSAAGGYVGNTGFGLANNVTTALSERLLALYADWVGVTAGGKAVSTAGALTLAKQAYLGQLGLYSGYDEKILMQAVYYGLPMYTVSQTATKFAPLPTVPQGPGGLQPVGEGTLGVMSAALTLSPQFTIPTDAQGNSLGYLTVPGQAPAVVPGQPVLPRIVSRLDAAPPGLTARGALITGLTSIIEEDITEPAVTQPGVGIDQAAATKTDVAFPSSYATVSRQQTADGPIDLLIVTPARVTINQNGRGVVEKFTSMTLEATYGDAASTDNTAPVIQSIQLPTPGNTTMSIRATDMSGPPDTIAGMVLLVQPEGSLTWSNVGVTRPGGTDTGDEWTAEVPNGPFRWILQVVDTAGNVTTETARGKLAVTSDPTYPEYTTGGEATAEVGSRFVRTIEVTDASLDEKLTATYTLHRGARSEDSLGNEEASGVAPVVTGPDGKTRLTIDQPILSPGPFTVVLKVCRGTACTSGYIDLNVPVPNSAPSATVSISSSPTAVWPTSVLTATAETADADEGDIVSVGYTWSVNGVATAYGEKFPMNGYVAAGDVVSVRAVPNDGTTDGHGATAEVSVLPAPPLPTITATATNADGVYTAGTWSRSPVTVTFACASPVEVTMCTGRQTVESTTVEGTRVSGFVTDINGRTVALETPVHVFVDTEAPTLAPTVTPASVTVGDPAPEAVANASDAASGIDPASVSCEAPDTATAGSKTLTCTATDVAGNSATGVANYTVLSSGPATPTITVTATAGSSTYVEGTWSRLPVRLTYTCTSEVNVTSCPRPRTVARETSSSGQVVTATMRDANGETASVAITVKIDKTPPKLSVSVSPSTVAVGGTALALPRATDAASGIASQTCGAVDTSTAGKKTLFCTATDAAGNTSTAKATYTVTKPGPPAPPARCSGVLDRAALAPINADGSSVFRATSGVPLVFRACDAQGQAIGTEGFVTGVDLVETRSLPRSAKVNELWFPPITGMAYSTVTRTWISTLATSSLIEGKKYTYRVSLADGTSFLVTFGVR
ncbi:hypothetical protein LG299_08910 [Microbacterium lacus]|uniref:hypothetical protein n=1 Tax=Microbacterium lacus TaxID=415217 RepID=UPI00384CDBC8